MDQIIWPKQGFHWKMRRIFERECSHLLESISQIWVWEGGGTGGRDCSVLYITDDYSNQVGTYLDYRLLYRSEKLSIIKVYFLKRKKQI